uniref:Palmdelphin n=1 Tax=Maylandia zebra TaxID=106582 RepID=A0A3P9B4Q7_9CICH
MFDLPSQDKRRIQEEIAKKRRQIEEEKLKLQYIKKKALREQWLMDGLSQQSEEEQEAMRLQAQDEQQQSDHLQSNIIRMEKEIEALETQELNISANEEIVVKRLKEVERTAEDIIKVMSESQSENHLKSQYSNTEFDYPDSCLLSVLLHCRTNPKDIRIADSDWMSTFAMKISVENDKKTGKSHVVSASTIIPETIQKNGIKVYDDGRKSVYALHPGTTKIHSETVGEMTPTEVEELLHQAADRNVPTEVQYHLPVYSVPYIGTNRPSTPRKSTKSLTKNSKPSPLRNVNSFKTGSLILNEKNHCSQGLQEQKPPNKTPLSICQDSTLKVRRVGEGAKLHSRETLDRSNLPSCAENNVSLNLVSTLPGELEPISMIFMGYENAEEEEDIQAELVIIDNSSDNNDNDEDENELNREEYLLYHPQGYRSKVFQPKVHTAKHSISPALEQQCLFAQKKKKRLQKYREEWEKHLAGKVHDNTFKAHCTVCRRTFSIGMLLVVGT